jgi:hypothetical protein
MKTEWIKFVMLDTPDRKTNIWQVYTSDGTQTLGFIKWFGAWRKYCYFPFADTVYEQDCLRRISEFIEAETSLYRQAAGAKVVGA